ncbi:nucleoside phosphorylase [Ulvibacterium marinum]|uniref:Uridine phosphorylase n=1 Tax=Ulvibacterium marinum TaxID=2419782 RepID=A0A3B0CC78_9FLAO|nr:nucleoside phosphorylase [Ulvibacterium marinum]RKN81237.1 phosphorylase [Ulvibacterium marinum]
MKFEKSELILNPDGSIYHLNLFPEDISDTIITVGDPNRVPDVSRYFDHIELKKEKREFHTHTGTLNGKRLTVISTGIGTDNIDIVLNELDALANIDFETRETKKNRIRFEIVRIGTSGALQPEIPLDSFLLSEYAIGFDGLLYFYKSKAIQHPEISEKLMLHLGWGQELVRPYVVKYDSNFVNKIGVNRIRLGVTVTNSGFYGPQGRRLSLEPKDDRFLSKLAAFNHKNLRITNLEMETSGIYGLAQLLGHSAISLNCILANRATGEFSKNPNMAVDKLIKFTLERLTSS